VIAVDLEREKVSLSMKDDAAAQAPRVESASNTERKTVGSKKDEQAGESTMKGNITFS